MDAPIPARAYYMINLLDTLRALGGEAHCSAVCDWMEDHDIARTADLGVIQKDGGTRFRKEVRFALKELFDAGMIGADGPGEWSLTPAGHETYLNHASANEVVRLNQKLRPLRKMARKRRSSGKKSAGRRRRPGPTKGPKPTSWSGTVTRDALGPAYTYIMRFGDSAIWKIGHTKSSEARLREVNRHVPSELLNTGWSLVSHEEWGNSVLAHAMEQRIFELLSNSRTLGERVRCSEGVLLQAWASAAAQVRAVSHKEGAPGQQR